MKQERTALWSPTSSRGGRYEAIFWLAAALLAGVVLAAYAPRFPWYGHYRDVEAFWPELTHRPFVYRVLLPLLAEAAGRIVPGEPELFFNAALYLSLVGFAAALRRLAHLIWQPSRYLDYVILAAIPLVIPLSVYHQHLYDLTTLCLFTWGIVYIAQQAWTPFLVVYAVACFNKETTLFLTFVFLAFHHRELGQRAYQRLLLMQLSIYMLIRATLMVLFRDRPGGVVEYHLLDHLTSYTSEPIRTSAYLAGILIVGALVAYRFRSKPLVLRKALLAVLPCMVVLFVLFGFPYELRVFYEVYGLIVLLCIPPGSFQLQGAHAKRANPLDQAV
ncbi:MAG TPA: hypothetical protein VFS21_19920 [Roseiflexaceae bacterium]|nr:hypothetical protein [Roseiflexaceae bacterium]